MKAIAKPPLNKRQLSNKLFNKDKLTNKPNNKLTNKVSSRELQ